MPKFGKAKQIMKFIEFRSCSHQNEKENLHCHIFTKDAIFCNHPERVRTTELDMFGIHQAMLGVTPANVA
jgi:hypothetical protein